MRADRVHGCSASQGLPPGIDTQRVRAACLSDYLGLLERRPEPAGGRRDAFERQLSWRRASGLPPLCPEAPWAAPLATSCPQVAGRGAVEPEAWFDTSAPSRAQAEGSEASAQDKVGRKRRPVLQEVDCNRRSKRNSGGAVSVRPCTLCPLTRWTLFASAVPARMKRPLRTLTVPETRSGTERDVEPRPDQGWCTL